MKNKPIQALIVMLLSLTAARAVHGQASFYQGKTVRIVVGYQSGDTHDLWSRAYARHMGKHIPGNPDIVVQNMPGAGSMIAANHVYNIAKPDGLTLGSIAPGLYLAQITGSKEVKFDWAKYSWIGTPEHNGTLLFMRADAALYAAKKEGKNRFMMAEPRTRASDSAPWSRQEPSSA